MCRFLGARSVTLRKAQTQGNPSVLALSSRTWFNYLWQGQLNFDPLIFDPLDLACGLSAGEVCPEGIIGISGETLRWAIISNPLFFVHLSPSATLCPRMKTWERMSRRPVCDKNCRNLSFKIVPIDPTEDSLSLLLLSKETMGSNRSLTFACSSTTESSLCLSSAPRSRWTRCRSPTLPAEWQSILLSSTYMSLRLTTEHSPHLRQLRSYQVLCVPVTSIRLTVFAKTPVPHVQENAEQYMVPPEQFGLPRAEAGTWGSCLRVVNAALPADEASLAQVHLDNNEAAFSMAVVPFAARDYALHLVVGTAKDTTVAPRTCSSGYLRVYSIEQDGAALELQHVVCLCYFCLGENPPANHPLPDRD